MHIPEADLEYLIRTLSEARSRATELAVSIGSRLGGEHRLTQLANSAASGIETTLREIRNGVAEKQDAQPVPRKPEIHTSSPVVASFAEVSGLDAEHWLPAFVQELLAHARLGGGITFERVERLLQQRKDEFLRDFLIARRMYRTYPHLFPEFADRARRATAP